MANLFQYAYAMERRFEEFLSDNGKGERKTTFMSDFSIADCFGDKAVTDTFKRAFKEWKNDVVYMAEFVCVLNHKIWEHYGSNDGLARLYDELWRKAHNACIEHFKGDDLSYYIDYLD